MRNEVYAYLPKSLLNLLKVKGLPNGEWICFTGESGSFKTLTCIQAAWTWLTRYKDKKFSVLFIPTECRKEVVLRQATALQMSLTPYVKTGNILFGDEFFENKSSYGNIPQWVKKRTEGFRKRFGKETRVLFIIDSVSSFWEGTPNKSRSVFTPIKANVDAYVDAAIVTLQLASGTKKGYGGGVAYAADFTIDLGSMIQDGWKKKWICIDKARDYDCDHRVFYYDIDKEKKRLKVGKPLPIRGFFSNPRSAIEGMKYYNHQLVNIEAQKNSGMVDEMKKTNAFLGRITKQLSAIKKQLDNEEKETS
jgi:KaiC/GvpD/RAD55 family RecA-like ATPase